MFTFEGPDTQSVSVEAVSEQLLPIVVAVCPAPLTLLGPCQCFFGQFLVTVITLIGSSAKGITSVKVLKV